MYLNELLVQLCTNYKCYFTEWQSFVEEEDIVVWKREDVNHRGKGLYCYKSMPTFLIMSVFFKS